jgi:glycosyltransferase involved in cell wall biosynthesis
MNILIIEPYFTGSHAAWIKGLKANSAHNIEVLSLPGKYWKWRMHGGAASLASEFMSGGYKPDLILATDMLNLPVFLSLTRERTHAIPVAVYFHENQLTYPWSKGDRDALKGRDRHYGFINYATALAADKVFFNSKYHMEAFLGELRSFLSNFPDNNELPSVERIRAKSSVLYYGVDFSGITDNKGKAEEWVSEKPLILWNHRWEFDKNPKEFFKALYILEDKRLDFEVALLGESFGSEPPKEFSLASERLGERVIHFGFAESRDEYTRILRRADILPVTSIHDFFGCSVVEAMAAGVYPILPRRLAYPEHIPEGFSEKYLYDDFDGLMGLLEGALNNIEETRADAENLREDVMRYGWDVMAPIYDREFELMIK